MSKKRVPDRGDIVWLDFNPQAGSEEAGRRPAFVVSPALYNGKSGLALLCPVTNQVKKYPYEVPLPSGMQTTGVILVDHIKSLDWQVRNASFIEKTPPVVTEDVLARLATLTT